MLNKIIRYLTDQDYRLQVDLNHGRYDSLSDEEFLKLKFKSMMGYDLDLDHPQTFNEKLQWLKLYDREPNHTIMVDKYLAKEYVGNIIGMEHIIPTLGVWDSSDRIDFDHLPNQFVLKCNHTSGIGVYLCSDKSAMDIEKVRSEFRKSMNYDYYKAYREWPYKNVPRKILAEQYMKDDCTRGLNDYKFFCFDGTVKCFKVDFDRFTSHHANYYDTSNHLLPFGEALFPPEPEKKIELPPEIPQMIQLAEKLSKGIPFVRIDFYDINHKIYFGEITFFPQAGFGSFTDPEWDRTLGDWINLPEKKITEQ